MAKEFFVHNRDFYKSFFGMTIVIALQNAIVFAVNLADAIMLSRYSETALSGVALLNQVQFLLQMMVFGIAEGALIFSAHSWGQKNIGAIHEVINIALKFSLATGIIMSVIAIFMPEKLLGLMTSDKAIIAEGARYARITIPTISWPTVIPGTARGTLPCFICKSLEQILAKVTLTIASRASKIVGFSFSIKANFPRSI